MFHIYIDKNTLADIYVKEKDKEESNQNAWYKIFKKQSYIYVNYDIKSDYSDEISILESQDDCDIRVLRELYRFQQLADFQHGFDIEIRKSKLVDMDQIENNPSIVHNDPSAIYLLKIDKQKADNIQKNYGVICQSIESLDDSILTKGCIDVSPHNGDDTYGWSRVLTMLKKIPSNAMLINDRNLFSNETLESSSGKPGNNLGIENLYEILEAIIPKKFFGNYHVFLCYDKSSLNQNVTTDYIYEQVLSLINRLRRRNPIILEIFILHGTNSPKYNLTHNRRILTNYFIITAEHMFKAFDGMKSICSQHITGNKLYNYGLYDNNDAPEKLHRNMINDFRKLVNYYINNPQNALYTYYSFDSNEKKPNLSDDSKKSQIIHSIENKIIAI